MGGPWEDYQPRSNAQPAGSIPTSGQPSPAYAPGAYGQTTPNYIGPQDAASIIADVRLNQGRQLPQIFNQMPGKQEQSAAALAIGKNAGDMIDRQRAGQQVLAMYKRLQGTMSGVDDPTLNSAIGPRNSAELAPETPTYIPGTHIPIWGLTGPTTVDPQTDAPVAGQITPVQRAAIMDPQNKSATSAWNTQNRLHHDVGALVNAYIASASKSGMNMSDSRQEAFTNAMGDFMKSSDRNSANGVLSDAGDMIHRVFSLVPPNARLAPDGNYYTPDPSRPGKYRMVVPANPDGPQQ